MTPEPTRTTARKSVSRPAAALLLAAVAVAVMYGAIHLLIQLPNAPYNVRELFPAPYRSVYIAVFSVLLVWLGFGPAWAAGLLLRRPRDVLLLPVWAALVGLVSWFLLRFSVTRESLFDIVGSPTAGWGGDWELMCRFLALQALGSLALLVAGVTVGGVGRLGWRPGLKRGATAALWTLPWLAFAWVVVVEWAGTDNLTELIRSRPFRWTGPAYLTGLIALIAANAAVLGCAWARRGGLSRLAAFAGTLLVTGSGWGLLCLGLEPAVKKYGVTFPAVRFLLGPDRRTAIPWGELFLRWGAVQVGTVVVLAWGAMVALRLRRGDEPAGQAVRGELETADEHHAPQHPGRAYLLIVAVYAVLLLYGCLMPFDLRPMSFAGAWQTFRNSVGLMRTAWSQSDVVTNVLMLVPLTFCALGAWSRENTRRGRWFMAPAIFAAAFAFSAGLEFIQVFVPQRVTSGHDIVSQTIGSAIGLGAWMVFGTPLTRWVRNLLGERRRQALRVKILYAYAAVFVVHNVLPLNPTISATQIWRKYKSGMINLVPFCDPATLDLYPLVMKTAVYVPIGWLLAILANRRRQQILTAMLGGMAFAFVLETLQVFVHSRMATATDVVLGTIGASVGGWMAYMFGAEAVGAGGHGKWWRRYGGWVKLAVIALWLSAMIWKRWWPFQFHWPEGGPGGGLGVVFSVPLFDIVRRIGPLEAISRLGRECGAFLVLGMLLQSLLACKGGPRRAFVFALTAVIAVALEYGRMFCSTYGPDATVSLAALAGCAASVWAYPRFSAIFLKASTSPPRP